MKCMSSDQFYVSNSTLHINRPSKSGKVFLCVTVVVVYVGGGGREGAIDGTPEATTFTISVQIVGYVYLRKTNGFIKRATVYFALNKTEAQCRYAS